MTEPSVLFPYPVQGIDTDERYTPRWVFDALGATFDLDPAAPTGGAPNVPTRAHYSVEDNGLIQPWHGLVWLNPPFSDMPPWVDRWIAHGNGCLLFPWSINALWIDTLLEAVEVVVRLRRPKFEHPTHTGRHVPVAIAVTALGDGVPLLDRLARHPEAGPAFRILPTGSESA